MKNSTTLFGLAAALFLTSAAFVASAAFNGDGIDDASGDRIVGLPNGGGSAVNNVVLENTPTGAPPVVTVEGSDANPSLALRAKGVGNVLVQGSSGRNIAAFEDAGGAHEYITFTGGVVGGGARMRADSAVSTDVDLRLDGQARGRVYLNGEDPNVRSWTVTMQSPMPGDTYTMAISDAMLIPSGLSSYVVGGGTVAFSIMRGYDRSMLGTFMNLSAYNVSGGGVTQTLTPPSGLPSVIGDDETVWIYIQGVSGTVGEMSVVLDTYIP